MIRNFGGGGSQQVNLSVDPVLALPAVSAFLKGNFADAGDIAHLPLIEVISCSPKNTPHQK